MSPVGQTMPHEIYEAWAHRYPDDAEYFVPLYDQAALAAAVAAERERCAAHIDVRWQREGREFANAIRHMSTPVAEIIGVAPHEA